MKDGAITINEDGTIGEISPTAGRLLGVKPEQYLGENLEELFNPNSMWVLDSSSRDIMEITISPKNGSSLVKARAARL